jgi:GNAT superfamily N-acetyltransferase
MSGPTIRELGKPGDLGWVLMAHVELYASEFGWDTSCETLFARILADFAAEPDRERNRAWIGEWRGERVGSVFCVAGDDPGTAKLRLLLVTQPGRGHRLGSRLVDTAIEFAGDAGYERMTLWTNHPLVAARRIYLEHGFRLAGEDPHHSFGVDLVGQTYELELSKRPIRSSPGSGSPR